MDGPPAPPVVFVVRVMRRDADSLVGVVERPRTGEKHPFHGIEAIGSIIQRAVDGLAAASSADAPGAPPEPEGP